MAGDKDWRSSTGTGIFAILLIVAAIGGGYWFMTKDKTRVLETVKSIVLDEDTGEIFEMELSTDPKLRPPYKSPKTGNMTVYRALQCQKCYAIYPWKEKDIRENQCPTCGNKFPAMLSFIPGAAPQQK